ncbi:pirin family protein [Rhodovibrionaceae bacterium A322]
MTELSSERPSTGDTQAGTPVARVLSPKVHDLGAFSVQRTLPAAEQRMVGPFVFFDHFGPAVLPADRPIDVRPHPHIGLATLTWLLEGEIMHRDSLGYVQEIKPGEVNWMTAGSGIVHSERSPERLEGQEKPVHGLQIWMALPKDKEEIDPSFQHYAASDLPVIEGPGLAATVVAGSAWGHTSPVAVYWETLYLDVRLQAGTALPLNLPHEERALYLLSGEIEMAGVRYKPGGMLVLEPAVQPEIRALSDSHFVMIGGKKMDGPRRLWWNFVSSSKERIEQAKEDWREGRFGKVPGDDEFIPLPD